MKVTALEEYGLRCMVQLAKTGPGQALSLAEIGEREGLSIPYAGKLMSMLKQGGVVTAERGRNGGYTLSRKPSEIRLREIFDALGEPIFGSNHCERFQSQDEAEKRLGECIHLEDCTVRDVWSSFHKMIGAYLDQITLEDVTHRRSSLNLDLVKMVEEKIGNRTRKAGAVVSEG